VPQSIDKLTAAMAAGDSKAVEAFYRRYFDWIYSQARRATGRDESFCLDVVQDSVLRVIRTVRPIATEGQFRAWVQLVVRTTSLDLMRSERRRRKREAAVIAGSAEEEPPIDERQPWLEEQIAKFDPMIVKAIEMRYRRGWTLSRVASMMGLSIGAIDGRLRRAIQELRTRAKEEFDE
jgi:RNA polymerase sigma factor (sigma-70 family)